MRIRIGRTRIRSSEVAGGLLVGGVAANVGAGAYELLRDPSTTKSTNPFPDPSYPFPDPNFGAAPASAAPAAAAPPAARPKASQPNPFADPDFGK